MKAALNEASIEAKSDFKAQLAELRQQQFSVFEDDSLAWLAMTPIWTERLAEASGFPHGKLTLQGFLAETENACLSQGGPQVAKRDLILRRTRGLMVLWPFLDTKQQRDRMSVRVREGLSEVTDEIEKLRIQIEIVPPGPQMEELLTAIDAQRARSKALLMTQLLSVSRSAAVLEKAKATVSEISDPETACRLLSAILKTFPGHPYVLERGLKLASGIDDPEARARALLLLAASLTSSAEKHSLQAKAVESIMQIPVVLDRVDALVAALPTLDPSVREMAIGPAITAAPDIPNTVHRAQILAGLGSYLRDGQRSAFIDVLRTAAAQARDIRDAVERDSALSMIATTLAEVSYANDAKEVASEIQTQVKRLVTLLGIAGTLPKQQAAEITATIFGSSQDLPRPELESLFLGVPGQCSVDLSRAVANRITDCVDSMISDRRFEPALKLLNLVKEKQKTLFLECMLNAVFAIGNEPEQSAALMLLAPHLSQRLLDLAADRLVELMPDRPFWMPDVAREDVIQYLREKRGTGFLQSAANKAGQAVLSAVKKQQLDIAPATMRWALIAAQCSDLAEAADFVKEKVYGAVEVGDLGGALEYAKATNELAGCLGQQLELAVAQIQHRIALAYRSAADERHLARFLPRKEYSDAIADLLNETGPHWAIHFLGAGGVGKTMLMRQLAARLAVKGGKRLATSRVDFDHINPEFPVRKPGELLAVLAEELRIFGGADQEDRYRRFQGDLTEFHGALSAVPLPDDPLQNIESPEFERLLHSFAALLNGLPKPVILILDTCEELAKLDPIGSSLPSVEATFRIIERVHDCEPGIRVIFAGRRLLARSGGLKTFAWKVCEDALPERNRMLPEKKDYLRLQIMNGFSESEAEDYFSRIVGVVLEPEQREAILKRSLDPGVPIEIGIGRAPSVADAVPRYNPFDLSLYADWVKEDPTVSAELLGSGETDPYVELRIMRRISNDGLRDAIPYAVLLQRFDMDMLRPVAGPGGHDLVRLFRDLGAEEWIEYQQDALQVDTKLIPRLQHYFEQPVRRYLLGQAKTQLAPALVALVRKHLEADNPLESLRVWHIDATLRLASDDDVAALWDLLDRYVTDTANWNWATTVCRSLLDKDNAARDENSLAYAAVRATYNAALVHLQPGYHARVREAWSGIGKASQQHPVSKVGRFIEARSRLWTEPLTDVLIEEIRKFDGDPWQREQLAAAIAAAMERELEKAEPVVLKFAPSNRELEDFSPEVRASLACSVARFSRKRDRARAAKRLAARLGARKIRQRWGDWRTPTSLASRIRLELLRIDPSAADWTELESWGRTADVATIDDERLLSRTLMLRLEYEPVEPPALEPVQIYDAKRRPECNAHLETPPLIATFVDAVLSKRLDAHCLDMLSDVRLRAVDNQDARTVQAVDAIKLKLDRRLRTALAMQALADLVATQHPNSTRFHHRWAVQSVASDADAATLVMQLDQLASTEYERPDGSLDVFTALDCYEGEMLAARIGETRSYVEALTPKLESGIEANRFVRKKNSTLGPHLEFRLAALRRTQPQLLATEQAKLRRLAEAALEEGEFLALRLPKRAIWLFEEAHRLFVRANDPLGENLAAISAAMAACRAGDRTGASDWLGRAGAQYQLRDPPRGDPVNAWVLRAAACAAWTREQDGEGPLSTWVSQGLAQRYGSAIPPELAFAPSEPVSDVSPSKISRGALLLSAVGIVALLAFVVFAAVRVRDAQNALLVAVGLLVEGSVFWLIWRAIRRQIMRVRYFVTSRRSIAIEPNRDKSLALQMEVGLLPQSAGQALASSARSPVIKRVLAMMLGLLQRQYRHKIAQPGFNSYSKGDLQFPPDVVASLNTPFWSDGVCLLLVDPATALYAWEAIIGSREGKGWRRAFFGKFAEFVRAGDVLPRVPKGFAEWRGAAIRVLSRRGLATAAWKSTTVDIRVAETLIASPASPLRVLHLIGRARRGTSGAVFSVGGQGNDLGELVSIDKLPLSATAIVVVQEEPAERLRRLNIDREQAADTRDWAAQVFRAGAHTVIFFPAMPLALAERSIAAFASKLNTSRAPDVWRLIEAARATRHVVTRFKDNRAEQRQTELKGEPDAAARDEDLRELAMEITLFSRSRDFQLMNQFTGFITTKGL